MPIKFRAALISTTLLVPVAVAAQAADTTPAPVQVAAADDEIVVYGRGETRSVSQIGEADIRLTTPGTSPLKDIQKLPGVNFQAADAFGAYEWAVRISLRGFNQNQLGFTLDGVPLGDMSYGNVNGLHISRAIISDNIGVVRVSQGAGALSTASTSNLGGTIEFLSRAPSDNFNIAANGTYGADDTYRAFVRVDTGEHNGFRGYLSYAYLNAGKWKGDGEQRSHQVNAKATYDFGGSGKITGFVNFSDRKEQDYQDLSLDIIRRLGYNDDNIADNFALAKQLARVYQNQAALAHKPDPLPLPYPTAGVAFPAPYGTVDDAYYDAGGLRRDWLTGLKIEGKLTDGLTASVQGYYHDNRGQGSWFTPYVASPGVDNPISFRTTEYSISRYGVIGKLSAELGRANTVDASVWYENNDFNQARRYYAVTGTTQPSTTALTYQSNPFFTQWYNAFNTETFQYSIQDTLKLGQLTVTAGFKGQAVKLTADQILVTNALATGRINTDDYFLPQAGALLRLSDSSELYINYTENQRAFTAGATGGSPFATTQAGFDAIRSQLRPETSRTLEGGYRYGAGPIHAVLTGYYVDFKNRILATTTGAGIVGNPTVLANVGSVRSYGIEAGLTWRIIKPLTLTASYAYDKSTYRDNVVDATGTITQAIRGRTVVDTPNHIANAELAFDQNGIYARINANYLSKRYFTYSNDQSVPGRVLVDAKAGYRFENAHGFLNGVAIEGSVTNLTDKTYIATVGSNGFGFSGDNQTLLAGAPRQWFVTLRKDF